jgi:hypothetical protein
VGVPEVGDLESAHRDFVVDEAPYNLWHWLEAHAPRGLRISGGESGTYQGAQMFGVNADLPVLPLNISLAELTVRVTGDKTGPSVVRVDSSVAWTPLRPAAEIVPARDGTLITSTIHAYEPGMPVGKHVITSDSKLVQPIVKAFNAARLEAVPGRDAFRECGFIGENAVVYRLEFATSPTAKPDIVATLSCLEIGVTVHGRGAPELQDLPAATWTQIRKVLGIAEPTA